MYPLTVSGLLYRELPFPVFAHGAAARQPSPIIVNYLAHSQRFALQGTGMKSLRHEPARRGAPAKLRASTSTFTAVQEAPAHV